MVIRSKVLGLIAVTKLVKYFDLAHSAKDFFDFLKKIL